MQAEVKHRIGKYFFKSRKQRAYARTHDKLNVPDVGGKIFFPDRSKHRGHARTHDKFKQPGNDGKRFSGSAISGRTYGRTGKENWAGLSTSPVVLLYACCGGSGGSGGGLRTGSAIGVADCMDQPLGASGVLGADLGGKGGGPDL